MTTLLLARHGETDWNRERRWQGHADPPLNEEGREQARPWPSELAEPIAAVYTSDLPARGRPQRSSPSDPPSRGPLDPRSARSMSASWAGLTTSEIEERSPRRRAALPERAARP